MIFELPNFINESQLNFINSEIQNHYTQKATQKLGSYRDGNTLFISSSNELKDLDDFLFSEIFASKRLLDFIQKRYKPFLETGDSGYEFHRYSPGDVCHIHSDNEAIFLTDNVNEKALLRFASVVLHLNTPKTGGELVFPNLNKTIKTEAGKIVIFPPYGFAQHYTNISDDNRDVIVTWLVYKNLFVSKS